MKKNALNSPCSDFANSVVVSGYLPLFFATFDCMRAKIPDSLDSMVAWLESDIT